MEKIKLNQRIALITIVMMILLSAIGLCGQYRYVNSIFDSVEITTGVIYGTAPFLNSFYYDENSFTTGNLVMDLYRPYGDIMTGRPAIIFAHGGGFITGNRNHDDMMAFCDSFAKKGYVTVTIDYRQGVYVASNADLHYTRSVYRGIQDGRAIVRYLRANASLYGIDPDMIYFTGSSAGAFICLHGIYMDNPAEKPGYANAVNYTDPLNAPYNFTGPDLGDFDIGENLTYSGEPNGIMSLWGAIASTALITVDNNEPVFLVHGTADSIVPFDVGSPFGVPTLPVTYGSNRINNKLDSLGLTDKMTYFVLGAGHEFYGVTNGMWDDSTGGNAYWDTVIWKATDFFWSIHKPNAGFGHSTNLLEATFSDSSEGAISWLWNFGDGDTSSVQNPIHTYLSEGTYDVSLYIENSFASWDTITKAVNVSLTGIENGYSSNYQIKNSNETITISFSLPLKDVDISVFDISGRIIMKKLDFSGNKLSLDMKQQNIGVYFVKINSIEKSIKIDFIK